MPLKQAKKWTLRQLCYDHVVLSTGQLIKKQKSSSQEKVKFFKLMFSFGKNIVFVFSLKDLIRKLLVYLTIKIIFQNIRDFYKQIQRFKVTCLFTGQYATGNYTFIFTFPVPIHSINALNACYTIFPP